MVEWVSEQQAENLKLESANTGLEKCLFCSKTFSTHNSFTAHLRWHSEDIDKMVYDVINSSSKPVRVATIQKLTNVNFSIKNAIQRLSRSGKIYHVKEGFSTRMTIPVSSKTTFELPSKDTSLSSVLPEDQINKLIVATLKRLQPEVYNSVVQQIVENMVRYAAGMAEIS